MATSVPAPGRSVAEVSPVGLCGGPPSLSLTPHHPPTASDLPPPQGGAWSLGATVPGLERDPDRTGLRRM